MSSNHRILRNVISLAALAERLRSQMSPGLRMYRRLATRTSAARRPLARCLVLQATCPALRVPVDGVEDMLMSG